MPEPNLQIKDIVNRDLVNLTNCENEPIHIPGTIQPHGFLLGLKQTAGQDWIVDFCSENCQEFAGLPHHNVLGKTFGEAFGANNQALLLGFLRQHTLPTLTPFTLVFNENIFHISMHLSEKTLIMEAEPAVAEIQAVESMHGQTRQFLAYMQRTSTLQELCQMVAEGTRSITGYDRVMVYRFDENYNGEVFAESRDEKFEPFLGLHYPHTDIPVQARMLYMKNLMRIITNVNYTPVPVFTVDDSPGKNLDMGMASLRGISPIHIQYLQNMGVGATLTISLIHDNRLWGLIACHHYSAKNISPAVRLAAQLQGHFITSQIDIRQRNEENELAIRIREALQKMITIDYSPDRSSLSAIISTPELIQLCHASGVAIVIQGEIFCGGLTPSVEIIAELAGKIATTHGHKTFFTEHINGAFEQIMTDCGNTAGLLYQPLDEHGDGVMWFRQETITEINWAGDPAKSIIHDENGLSPRKSFETWKETVKCRSKKWQQPEINATQVFTQSLQKHLGNIRVVEEEKKTRILNEILHQTNIELENINWITTHDMQEPLRKIQMFASRMLMKSELKSEVMTTLEKIYNSADKMRLLINDLVKYNRLRNSEAEMEKIDMGQVISTVLEEIREQVDEKEAVVQVGPLPVIKGIPFMIVQLMTNLLQNSLKFSSPQRSPVIQVTAAYPMQAPSRAGDFVRISVRDNGMGFDQKFAPTIFDLFRRLHGHHNIPGTGIGLALCKKIMNMHGGDIAAEGKADEFAVIHLYFPMS